VAGFEEQIGLRPSESFQSRNFTAETTADTPVRHQGTSVVATGNSPLRLEPANAPV
jgi:hypothetical protein